MAERITLTKAALDRIAPPVAGKRREVYDARVPGLIVRITSAGTRSFCVYGRVKGDPHPTRVRLGPYPGMTIEQARKAAQRELANMSEGAHPAVAKRTALAIKRTERARGKTLRAVLDDYLATRALKENTAAHYRAALHETCPDWLDRPLSAITREAIAERHHAHGKRSKARANLAVRVLRALFNFAQARYRDDNGRPLIAENPTRIIGETRAWHRVDRRTTYLKPAQLPDWFKAVAALENDAARDLFVTLLLTGLRVNEGARLKWADVDLDDRTLTVRDPKNREDHVLPLPDFLLDLLKARKEAGGEYVFPGRIGHLGYPKDWVAKVSKASGIAWAPHDLRRTFATTADGLDIPAYALKRLLGHKMQADVTAGYIVRDIERLRRPMQAVCDHLLTAAGVRASNVVPLKQAAT